MVLCKYSIAILQEAGVDMAAISVILGHAHDTSQRHESNVANSARHLYPDSPECPPNDPERVCRNIEDQKELTKSFLLSNGLR